MAIRNTSPGGVMDAPERPPYGLRKSIEAVKDAVRIETVAADYGEFKFQGQGRLLGRCLSPAHEDRTPSMTVYTERQTFRCYGCQEHGDVIDLVQLVEGGETWEAMMVLADRYHVALPERSPAWYARQKRQRPVRDALEEARIQRCQRRLYRWLFRLVVDSFKDADERRNEKRIAWDECGRIARMIAARTRGEAR